MFSDFTQNAENIMIFIKIREFKISLFLIKSAMLKTSVIIFASLKSFKSDYQINRLNQVQKTLIMSNIPNNLSDMNNKNYVSDLTNKTTKDFSPSVFTNDSVEANGKQTNCEICRFHEAQYYAKNFGNICSKCAEWFEQDEKFNL